MARKASDNAFFLIMGVPLIFSLSYNILNATIIPISIPMIVFFALLFLVLFGAIFYNRYTFVIAMAILSATVLLVTIKFDSSWLDKPEAKGLMAYARDLILFIRGYSAYDDSFGPVIVICVCGFLAMYITLSIYVSFQFYFIALLGIGVFSVNAIMDYKRSEFSFVLFIFCFCVLLCKKLNNRKPDGSVAAFCMMPVCFIAVLLAHSLPAVEKNWDSAAATEIIKTPLDSTNNFFYFLFNPKYFSFQTTGFEGKSGRLGGSLILNGRDVMKVKADKPTYLAGIVKDKYTGFSWLNSDPGFTIPYNSEAAGAEFFETTLSLPVQFSFGMSDGSALAVRNMTVYIGASRIGTLFRPMKNSGVKIDTDLSLFMDSAGDLHLSDALPADSEYGYEYMDIDYTDATIQSLMRGAHRGFYREAVDASLYADLAAEYLGGGVSEDASIFSDSIRNYESGDQRYIWGMWEYVKRSHPEVILIDPLKYFSGTLAPYANRVYETYMDLPDTLPKRVKELSAELTAHAGNDYDRAKAIESYLSAFPYTLTPETPPVDRDFVDYFLFDGKEGYCTYYASAMVVLCRAAGIPGRYVEGYIIPPTATNGVYSITNLQAHAWPEIYLEGFGWAPFEPTAPYSYVFNQVAPPSSQQVFSSDFESNPDYEEYIEMIGGGMDKGQPAVTLAPAAQPQQSSFMKTIMPLLMFLGALLLVSACVAGLILKGKYELWRRRKLIKGLPRDEQAIEYFRDIIKMTRYYRYPMRNSETPSAYAGRIGKRFAFSNDSIFIHDLTKIYNKAKFANDTIQAGDLDLMKSCHDELLVFIRYMRWRPVFIWGRYIARRI